ncbi:hypothetical protein VN97_g7315 [Penicillium thymicola]|uniref:Uncharacterized protein n=1 Tax=Penicillium thymicola TaxID=293382 RepID=A0AAI9TF74_PENTH|nr:hypothetical protein VN97_g7315 [Penicillium thymicola]
MTPNASLSRDQEDIVVNILHMLEASGRSSFSKLEIARPEVFVKTFGPNDKDFLASEQCLFKPISKEDIKPWKISAAEAAVVRNNLDIPDLGPVSQHRPTWNITVATQQVFHFIIAQFRYRRRGKTSLRDTFGWNGIDHEEFYGGNKGFLYSPSGRCKGVDTPGWRTCLLEEWWDGEILAGPSVRFIICTDGIAEEDSLLLSELGAVAQVIAFRRTQPEFQTSLLFPVLMISHFGPRHGRIVQACYDRRGDRLELRISQVFCFANRSDAEFDIFVRFTASYPPEIANPTFFHDSRWALEGRSENLPLRLQEFP